MARRKEIVPERFRVKKKKSKGNPENSESDKTLHSEMKLLYKRADQATGSSKGKIGGLVKQPEPRSKAKRKHYAEKYKNKPWSKTIFHRIEGTAIKRKVKGLLRKYEAKVIPMLIFDSATVVLGSNYLAKLILNKKVRVMSEIDNDIVKSYCERLHYLSTENSSTSAKVLVETANEYALEIGGKIHELHNAGNLTLEEKANSLDKLGVPTRRGKDNWDASSVRNVYLRWQELTGNKVDVANTYSNKSEAFAMKIGPVLESMETEGLTTYQSKVEELGKRKIQTFRGNFNWSVSSVANVEKKYKKLKENNSATKPE
ncbi:MAG: hypothetical protein Roseis2KO_07260 [Roseivirga sp.]